MPIPLRSESSAPPPNVQFAHFGVLNDGAQSKTSTVTSLVLNVLIAFVIIVIGAAARKTVMKNQKLTELTEPVIMKKVEPIKPKIIPPKPLPKLPEIPKLEVATPKIIVPVKLPDVPKPPDVKMEEPKPVLLPPTPKQVVAVAAPVAVNLAHPQAASVVNNDAHPTAVRLGSQDSPVSNLKGPAVASVNLARGMPGMNSANTGNGTPAATKVVLGNGSPESTTIKGNGAVAVVGLGHGVPQGTGTANHAGQVNLGQVTPPPMPKPAAASAPVQQSGPKVLYKPKPEYTAEAIQMHVEGKVSIRIRVMADGSVEVIGVTSGLGHGLDESAKRAIQATKFEPATDASGHPIVWDGVVNVTFQLAG